MTLSNSSPASIANIITKGIDVLRGKVEAKDYHAFSFLLYLQSRGIISNTTRLKAYNVRGDIYEKVLLPEYQYKDKVAPLLKYFQKAINRIEDQTLYDLLRLIESLDRDFLSLNLGELIEGMIYQVAKSEGRHGGEYVQPLELTKFICALADVPQGATVYNPFAGIASLGVYLDDDVSYFGQELYSRSWAIGMLRLIANNKAITSELVVGDSINNWNPKSEQYDFILANPPFGLKAALDNSSAKSSFSIDAFVIEKSIESLKYQGTAILVLSNSFLYSGRKDHKDLRKSLLEFGFVKNVISFPGGLLTNTNIPFTVLVLNKTRRRREVLFVDAANSVKEVSRRDRRIDFDHLLSVVNTPALPHSKVVSTQEIINNDFNFNVTRYLLEETAVPTGEELGKLLRRVPKSKGPFKFQGSIRTGLDDSFGSFVRIRDLKNEIQDFELDASSIEMMDVPKTAVKLERSALLLATRWKSLKPTYFQYRDEPIYLSPDIVAFEVNERMVDVAYLVNELHADYVTDQLNRYRVGTTVPAIPVNELLKVEIILPELKEQRTRVTGNVFRALETEKAALQKQAYEELASIKHSMGKPLLNLNAGVRNIEAVLGKLDKEWESIRLSNKADYTLRDAVNSIFANLNLLSNLLKNNERELDVSTYALSQVEIKSFFERFVKDLQATDGEKFTVKLDISPDLEEGFVGSLYIKGNEELLSIALNNIIDNAQRHGFIEPDRKYKVEVRLSLHIDKDSVFVKIEIANNGEPFPKNFTLEKLVRKASIAGATGNSGVGGYDINEIVKRHSGKLDVITDPEVADPFTTIYEILIPINASNGNNE